MKITAADMQRLAESLLAMPMPSNMAICGVCFEHYRLDDDEACPYCGNVPTEIIPIEEA